MTGKIEKEDFIKLINRYKKNNTYIDKVCEIFPYFYESEVVDFGWLMFESLIRALFEEEGADWINWWLMEKGDNPEFKAYDKDNKEIPTETVDDLWNLVEEYRK